MGRGWMTPLAAKVGPGDHQDHKPDRHVQAFSGPRAILGRKTRRGDFLFCAPGAIFFFPLPKRKLVGGGPLFPLRKPLWPSFFKENQKWQAETSAGARLPRIPRPRASCPPPPAGVGVEEIMNEGRPFEPRQQSPNAPCSPIHHRRAGASRKFRFFLLRGFPNLLRITH